MANIIDAIMNLVNYPILDIKAYYKARNRANAEGDSLEEYIKDLFAGTAAESDEKLRLEKLSQVFSYFGNNSNPPDAMLIGGDNGDAIEVKKETTQKSKNGITGELQLNSSHPMQKLKSKSTLIADNCRKIEEGWKERDLLYSVGYIKNKTLLTDLFFVYGMDYAAAESTYLKIKNTIKAAVTATGKSNGNGKELGLVKRIDPLGITDLRVRGMWKIKTPMEVFSYVYQRDNYAKFYFTAIINSTKYESFNNTAALEALAEKNQNFNIIDVRIKNPDNPAQLRNAKMITFSVY